MRTRRESCRSTSRASTPPNTARFPLVADAKLALGELNEALGDFRAPQSWADYAATQKRAWDAYVDDNVSGVAADGANRPMSYAQVIGVVNALCHPRDRIVTAAGGLPAEVAANWRTKSPGTVDVEFGFSCMGYEIAGGWGARIAQVESEPERDTIVLVGDGSYLMLNSDLYSSVLTDKKIIVIVCDNGGFAVIHKLQVGHGQRALQQSHQGLPRRFDALCGRLRRARPRAGRRGRDGRLARRTARSVRPRKGCETHVCDQPEG